MRIELTVSLPIFHAKDDLEESVHELEKLLVAYCWIPFTIRMTAYKPSVDIVELPGKGLGVLAKKDFEPEFSFVSSQKEYMHDTWNDIAKYCKKKARTNLDEKIAKIRKERKGDQNGESSGSSEEELSEDEMVEDRVNVKQGDLKRKMKKRAAMAPDSGIDIQVSSSTFICHLNLMVPILR